MLIVLSIGAGPVWSGTEKHDIDAEAAMIDDLADGQLDAHTLIEAALIASGVTDPEGLASYEARIEAIVDGAVSRVGDGRDLRRGRRLLEELHGSVLERYEASSDRFTDLVDGGSYNCVSATLLYIIAARQAGLRVAAAETPLHVFALIEDGDRQIEVETTTPEGYDVHRDLPEFSRFVLANKYATEEEIAQRGIESLYDDFRRLTKPVAPERIIAFLYHNAGLRALRAGASTEAAGLLVKAARIYPDLAYRSEDLRLTLAWAIREQYDSGRFEEAYRLSGVAMVHFPDRTTVRDRFVVVAARLIEEAAREGNLAEAEGLEAESLELLSDEDSRRRLEAFTAQALVRAAVTAGEWPMARKRAARFAEVTDDPEEAQRLDRWLKTRDPEASQGTESASNLEDEMNEVLEETPEGVNGRAYSAVVRAIVSLGEQGLYDEALAVGHLQREGLEPDAIHRLDILLRAIVGDKIGSLLRTHRCLDASNTLDAAIDQWPEDQRLHELSRKSCAALADGTRGLNELPETVRSGPETVPAGSPGSGTARD